MHHQLKPLLSIAVTDFAAADEIVNCDERARTSLVDGMLELMEQSPVVQKLVRDHVTAVLRMQQRAHQAETDADSVACRTQIKLMQRRFTAAMVLRGFVMGHMRAEAARR